MSSDFFVPESVVPPGYTSETVYAELAKFAGAHSQPVDRRIASITWLHDGEVWTATVGQTLTGESTRKRTRGGRKVDVTENLRDPAKVLAIFAGPPCYLVVTDARPFATSVSHWANPLMAGQPRDVSYFSAA